MQKQNKQSISLLDINVFENNGQQTQISKNDHFDAQQRDSEYKSQQQQQKNDQIKILLKLEQGLIECQQFIFKHFEEIIFKIKSRIAELNSANFQNFNNNSFLIHIFQSFQKLLQKDLFLEQYNVLKDLQSNQKQFQTYISVQKIESISTEPPKFINLQLINKLKQDLYSFAMAFNNSCQIIVTGVGNNIKVWQFMNEKLKDQTILECQGRLITCLVFSQKNQWFISGDQQGIIQFWKQGRNISSWKSMGPKNNHCNYISQLILTNQEDQLISSSFDKTIIVWTILPQNDIKYSYTLENQHQNQIYCMSLNQSENYLVSASSYNEKQIILWKKSEDLKWIYKNYFKMQNEIPRVCFINDNQILIQQWGQGYINILKIMNEQFLEQKDHKIILEKEIQKDWILFPTIYNREKDFFLYKRQVITFLLLKNHKTISFQLKKILSIVKQMKSMVQCQVMDSIQLYGIQKERNLKSLKLQFIKGLIIDRFILSQIFLNIYIKIIC